jgi:short-subunit dehydrogenase
MEIRGSVAVVTGASSGIGEAVAVALAAKGATVAGIARRVDRLEAVIARCAAHTPGALAIPADVGDGAQAEHAIHVAEQSLGRIDILVNNAGISPGEDPLHNLVDDAYRVMTVNFFGAVHTTAAVLDGMVARGKGSIVNVTSVAGYVPNPGEAAYGASKAALSRWSHGLAVDLHDKGIHVGVLSPGPIATEIWDTNGTAHYDGKLYPASMVADGIVRIIERGITHMTVPRRFGAVGVLYPLAGAPMRWSLRRYGSR